MRRYLCSTCVACLLVAWSQTVMAQRGYSDKQNYVGITLGSVSDNYLTGELDSDDDTLNFNNYKSLYLEQGYMTSLRVGRTTTPPDAFAAIELEGLLILGTDIDDNKFYYREFSVGSNVFMNADISIEAVMGNLYLRDPRGSVHPYIGFGLGWAWTDIDMDLQLQPGFAWPGTTNRSGGISSSESDYAVQALLGFDWHMTDTLGLDIGYRYFHTQAEIEDSIGTTDFDIDTTYDTHMLTAGLRYMF